MKSYRLALALVCTTGALVGVAGETSAWCGNARLKGALGDRLEAMIERHVVATDIDYLTASFQEKTERQNRWQTEFWGKYMHAAVPYLGYCHSEKLKTAIERGVESILASQEQSGYIGNYPDELRCGEGWDVWGMKYTLLGLIHYYDGTRAGSKVEIGKGDRALAAAKRLCDYVIAEIGPKGKRGQELWQTGNWSGYASSSILEPVVWLYRRTQEKKYLDFADYIVRGLSEPKSGPRLVDLALKGVSVADRNGYDNVAETHGGYVMKHNRWKAYEMMSCYQGLVEYYEVTGRKDLLDAAIATGGQIVSDEVNLAGGCSCSEAWFHGARKQHLPFTALQETCVVTTWMRFCEKLLDVTDDPKWADQIERSFYNVYLASMRSDGSDFVAYTPLTGNRYPGKHHCFMHTDCCNANGPRGFLCFLRKMFCIRNGAAVFNFYGSALVGDRIPGTDKKVSFDMYSLYPRGDTARIVSHTEGVGVLPLKLRIPAWAEGSTVTLNGKPCDGVKAGAYFILNHEWKLGDVVEVKFAMPVVAHTICDGEVMPDAFAGKNDKAKPAERYVAFTRGPILLARDSRLDDGDDPTEPFRRGCFTDGQKVDGFNAVRSPSDDIWMTFTATLPIGSHVENPEGELPETVAFCDFASAGNAWTRKNHYRTWFPVEYGPTE